MCGITGIFMRESRIDQRHLDTLFSGCESRGQDGFGFVTIKNGSEGRKIDFVFRDHRPYHEIRDLVLQRIQEQNLPIGSVILGIARAAPESEGNTDASRINETMQPIVSKEHGLVVIHNGAVSGRIQRELKEWAIGSKEYSFSTDIDSECILASYIKHQRNMKDCMQTISGGFAIIAYDQNKDMLYVVNDHMQISHGYIRGLGFFLHSNNEDIGKVIRDYTGATRDGMFLWENFYHHSLEGGYIREIDLQSGFMRKQKYTPRYLVGDTFDSKKD